MRDKSNYDPGSDGISQQEGERVWSDDDPLVRRLRGMKWAEVPVEVRERCWGEIKHRIDDLESQGLFPVSPRRPEVNCERYGFSRRLVPCEHGVSHSGSGAAGPAMRTSAIAFAGR
jgi:hypothetical protein